MPRYLRTFDEIKKGVVLQFEGHTFASIAKVLTAEYIQQLYKDGHLTPFERTNLITVSENRKIDENIKDLFKKMKKYIADGNKIEDSVLRNAIVHPKRIRTLAKSEQWKDFKTAFEKEHTKLEAEKAAKEAFDKKNAE